MWNGLLVGAPGGPCTEGSRWKGCGAIKRSSRYDPAQCTAEDDQHLPTPQQRGSTRAARAPVKSGRTVSHDCFPLSTKFFRRLPGCPKLPYHRRTRGVSSAPPKRKQGMAPRPARHCLSGARGVQSVWAEWTALILLLPSVCCTCLRPPDVMTKPSNWPQR